MLVHRGFGTPIEQSFSTSVRTRQAARTFKAAAIVMAPASYSRLGRPHAMQPSKAVRALAAKTKIAIACQGGGSQTAFTAGALKALCEAGIADEFEIVSMSGTSGGLCAQCSSGTH